MDDVLTALPAADAVLAVEYLPGQFDQRADSAAQCIQLLTAGERPAVRTARVYLFYGSLSEAELAAIRRYVINPVEAREASLDEAATLRTDAAVPPPWKPSPGSPGWTRPVWAPCWTEWDWRWIWTT